MAIQTAYPTGLDSVPADVASGDAIPSLDWNTYFDAVVALETKVGITSSAVESTVDYQLSTRVSATNIYSTTLTGNYIRVAALRSIGTNTLAVSSDSALSGEIWIGNQSYINRIGANDSEALYWMMCGSDPLVYYLKLDISAGKNWIRNSSRDLYILSDAATGIIVGQADGKVSIPGTLSATNVYATTLTATTLTATTVCASNFYGIPTQLQRLLLPAAVWETRAATGWAAFAQTQGTNFDYGEFDFDQSTDEKIVTPPFRLTNWAGGALSANVIWKSTAIATSQSAVWVIRSVAMSGNETFDASMTQNASAADTPPSAAGLLKNTAITFTPANISNNDLVVLELYRNADDATYDTMSADAILLNFHLEWL